MKKIYIVNVGSTHSDLIEKYGDFEVWAKRALTEQGIDDSKIKFLDGINAAFPEHHQLAGVIIMGSLAMATEKTDWMLRLSEQIVSLTQKQIPLLGICFGHQLIAQALGGKVGYHPDGLESGTTEIQLLPARKTDPLFQDFPESFKANVVHYQSVLTLPPQAVHLARNNFEPHHSFRAGNCTWGVQFHPEFTADIMRDTLTHLKENLGDAYQAKLEQIHKTDTARQVLFNFARYALQM